MRLETPAILASDGGECGERFGVVNDASLRLAPAKPVLRIIDKAEPASPIMPAWNVSGSAAVSYLSEPR